MSLDTRARVVILGGGFGGIYTALRLEKALTGGAALDVTLVSRENFFLFIPMRTIYLSKRPRLEKKVRVALDWLLDIAFSKDLVQIRTLRPPTMSHPEAEARPAAAAGSWA